MVAMSATLEWQVNELIVDQKYRLQGPLPVLVLGCRESRCVGVQELDSIFLAVPTCRMNHVKNIE